MVYKKRSRAAKSAKVTKETFEKPTSKLTENVNGDADAATVAKPVGKRKANKASVKTRSTSKEEVTSKKKKLNSDTEDLSDKGPKENLDDVNDLPAHSSKAKTVTSKDGRNVTNIAFEEGDDFADMEVTGEITPMQTVDDQSSLIDDSESEMSRSWSASASCAELTLPSQTDHDENRSSESGEILMEFERSRSPVKQDGKNRKQKGKRKKKRREIKDMALEKMKKYMVRKGLVDSNISDGELQELLNSGDESSSDTGRSKTPKPRRRKQKTGNQDIIINSPSETTIHRPAVKCKEAITSQRFNRASSSDNEVLLANSSGSISDAKGRDYNNVEYISEHDRSSKRRRCSHTRSQSQSRSRSHSWSRPRKLHKRNNSNKSSQSASCSELGSDDEHRSKQRSRGRSRSRHRSKNRDRYRHSKRRSHSRGSRDVEEERSEQLIRDAEKAKARMFDISANKQLQGINEFMHSAMVDESFKFMGVHIDESTRNKIQSFAYIDLARLLPRDKIVEQEDNRLTWVQKNGQPWLVPAPEYNNSNGNINSDAKWYIAFRIYSEILTAKYPTKASELIQYEHIIYTVAQTYAWQNVYLYDKDFRIHISKNPL